MPLTCTGSERAPELLACVTRPYKVEPMRHLLVVLALVGTACSVGIGDENEQDTINRSGIRVFNALVGAPAMSVTVSGSPVADAANLQALEATQYVGRDAGTFPLRLVATDGSVTFTPRNLGQGYGSRDRMLVVLSGPATEAGLRTPIFRERRNDGNFERDVTVVPVPGGRTRLRLVNATVDIASVTFTLYGAQYTLGLDGDVVVDAPEADAPAEWRQTVPADVAFPVSLTDGTTTDVSDCPALPSASDATILAVGSTGGTGASTFRMVYLPSPQGANAPAPVVLDANPTVVVVNGTGAAASIAVGPAEAATVAAGAALAAQQSAPLFAATVDGVAVPPVALEGAALVVLAPSGSGIAAYVFGSALPAGAVQAVNLIVGSGARDVRLGTATLGTDLVYGAAGPVTTASVATATTLTATTDTSTYTFALPATANAQFLVLTGDAAGDVVATIINTSSNATVVAGTKTP